MTDYIVNGADLTGIANKIRAKGQTSAPIVFPGGFVDAIDNLPSGGGSVAANAVNFRDYDGTIVASYSASDFANLTALPANPDRTSEGLTAQGWNWSLADAKTYVASYGKLNVGQMYITTDGKTHIHIHLEQGRTSPMLGVCPNGTVDVDWGDGTTHDTLTGTSTTTVQWTPAHNYAAPGDYVIKLTVSEGGSMGFSGSSSGTELSCLLRYGSTGDNRNKVYQKAIHALFIGSGVTKIGQYALNGCGISSITIPSGVTSIETSAFNNCYILSSVNVPSGVTSIGQNAFYNCYSLFSVTLPVSATGIGNYAFYYCYSLQNVNIPSGNYVNENTFQNCYSLSSITIPSSITYIGGNAFSGCSNLKNVTMQNSGSITAGVFNGCSGLPSITIPSGLSSIGNNAFNYCYGLGELHFKPTTPPTIINANAFANLPTDCKIYVPTGKLSDYTGASNYPSSATYTYVEE